MYEVLANDRYCTVVLHECASVLKAVKTYRYRYLQFANVVYGFDRSEVRVA